MTIRASAPGRENRAPRMLTQGQIESEIMRLSASLEAATDDLAKFSEDAALAEIEWKKRDAAARLKSDRSNAEDRKADSLMQNTSAFHSYRVAETLRDSAAERCRTLRAQLDALRTLSANVRSQT